MTSTSDPSSTPTDRILADTYRAEWGRLLSLLIARTRRLDFAEDALGEAFVRASAHSPEAGAPANPAAWLYTTAHCPIIGDLRAEAVVGREAPIHHCPGLDLPTSCNRDDEGGPVGVGGASACACDWTTDPTDEPGLVPGVRPVIPCGDDKSRC